MGAIVLTCAAYKLSISTNIPAIAYLTLLDVYVVACMGMCILLVFEAALVRDALLDHICLILSAGARARAAPDAGC